MGVIRNALQKQIQNDGLNRYSNTTAIILSYDIVTNTATIKFPDPNGDGYMYRENVTFANTLGAATGSGIYTGQTCTISFIGGNIWSPIITGLADNLYESKTSPDQGAYIIGVDNDNIYTKPDNISPMMNDWIDENNTNKNKYNNDLWDYTKSDTTQEVHELLQSMDKYTAQESGITNLDTKSTVKLKENGDIDIFVSHNVGIRISNTDHKIYMYGLGLYLNNKEPRIPIYCKENIQFSLIGFKSSQMWSPNSLFFEDIEVDSNLIFKPLPTQKEMDNMQPSLFDDLDNE